MPHLVKFLGLAAVMLCLSVFQVGQAVNFIIAGIAIWKLTS